ncbi:efflux RND transporter periplasmic adaptor subunit [Vallicoccus soli]|uniref:Efflux RND transporter periplasmic adaptor subunit n=1 Tax=Vallicoccus soli TaxID=2339232 RepID=A0A3A3YZ29_9ACTN|nr:efflux RND transporter periplasmic adaptor subunit [Vallicoccus soli]RJK96072.1 efflux RND transporter periplasmic adaptor subunit [Vallicoccus soli]
MRGPRTTRVVAPAVLAALLALTGCSGEEAPDVEVAEVGLATVSEVVEAPGTVTARATGSVSAPAAGTVAVLRVEDGQRVRAGAELLRIDSPDAEAALREARAADEDAASAGQVDLPGTDLGAEQDAADAAAETAFARARRTAALVPDGPARAQALAAVDAARAQYDAARAQARDAARRFDAGLASLGEALSSLGQAQRVQTRAALAAAERTVDALVVRAPVGGVVSLGARAGGDAPAGDLGDVAADLPADLQGAAGALLGGGGGGGDAVEGQVAVGSPVTAGQELLTVTDVSALSLTAQVDETDVLLVRPGVRASVELDAVPGASYGAVVQSVDVQPTTSAVGGVTYAVRLALGPGEDGDGARAPRPRPGMSAVVGLEVRRAEDAVAVPASAVFQDGADRAVWVADGGAAERRVVRVGAEGEEAVQVVEGLRAGERVVVSGADRVQEGQELP